MEIVQADLFECLEDLRDSSVCQVVDRFEADVATQHQQKRYFVDKEDVKRQKSLFVELEQPHRNSNYVPCHWIRFAPHGFAFEGCNILSPDLEGNVTILDRHWAVLYLVALYHPFKVLYRKVAEHSIQSPCTLCSLDLPLSKAFLISRDSVKK